MSEKFPTWNGHLPQTGLCGLRPIQVWTKSPGKFPTWLRLLRCGDFGRSATALDGEAGRGNLLLSRGLPKRSGQETTLAG